MCRRLFYGNRLRFVWILFLVFFLFKPHFLTAAPASENEKTSDTVFRTEFVKVTAKSLKKDGNTITLTLVYENISGENLTFGLGKKSTFLTDEDGERWDYKANTAIREWTFTSSLAPKKRIVSKFTFATKGNTGGKMFNLYNENRGGKNFTVIINDIPGE